MRNLRRFENKTVIVTGSGSGIGRGMAIRLAEEGAYVAVHDYNAEGAAETVRMIEEASGKAKAYKVDVSSWDEVKKVVDETLKDLGRIDYLCCNADIFDMTNDDWQRVTGVNLDGVWNYCRIVSEIMAKAGGGAIVNTSSIGSISASYMRIPYMASKGGVKMMTQAMAQDLGKYNIRINAVAPGCIETEMTRPDEDRPGVSSRDMICTLTAVHRYGKPEDIAAATAFLLSDDAAYITGTTLVVDGGMTAGNTIGLPLRFIPKDGYEDEAYWLKEFDYVKEYLEMKKKSNS